MNSPYSFRVGDLRTLVSTSIGLEYESNPRLVSRSPKGDFNISPSLSLSAIYPLGEANVVNFSLDMAYSRYLENEDLNRFTILPGSTLSFDLFVKDLRINLHERFSYQLDPTVVGAVSGVEEYGGMENTVGVLIDWNLQDVVLSFGYDFLRFASATTSSDTESRMSHLFLGRAGVSVRPGLVLGTEFTASPTIYDEKFHNDSINYSAGAYAHWQVTESINLRPRLSYVIYSFSDNGLAGKIPDFDGYYLDVAMSHSLSEYVTYSLTAGRSLSPGVTGNVSDVWRGQVSALWSLLRNQPITTSVFYEDGAESAGPFNQDYQRVGFTLGLSRNIFVPALTGALNYAYITRTSGQRNGDYDLHRVAIQFRYQF